MSLWPPVSTSPRRQRCLWAFVVPSRRKGSSDGTRPARGPGRRQSLAATPGSLRSRRGAGALNDLVVLAIDPLGQVQIELDVPVGVLFKAHGAAIVFLHHRWD